MKAFQFILAISIALFLIPSICNSQISIIPDNNNLDDKYEFILNPYGSLRLSIQEPNLSVFIGDYAGEFNGQNATTLLHSISNVGIGGQSLRFNTIGRFNTAIGSSSMRQNISGDYNTALGLGTLYYNTTGTSNCALGAHALNKNVIGGYNVAVGRGALSNQITGSYSVAVGHNAGHNDTLSHRNVFVGPYAGEGGYDFTSLHGKSYNVMLGFGAGRFNQGDGNIFIGYTAGENEPSSNRLVIENSDADSTAALIYGDFENDKLKFNAGLTINKNSANGDPQLNLNEDDGGFARLQFSNTSGKQITLAAAPNETVVDSRLNFFIEDAGDVMTIRGDQRVGINDSSPSQTLDINAVTGDSPFRVRTGSTEHINVSSTGVTTVNNSLLVDGVLGIENQYSFPQDYTQNKVLKSSTLGDTYWGDEFWLRSANGEDVYNVNEKIGIGVGSPEYKLDIKDSAPSDYVMRIINGAPASDSNDGLAIVINTLTSPETDNHYISFKLGNGNNIAAIRGDGAGGVKLAQLSDRRHKQNIQTFSGGLDVIATLDAYTYEMKVAPGKQQIGFIAQELYKSFPQIVSGTPETSTFEDPMMVDYSGITPVLVSAIKELAVKNEELSKKLDMIYEVIGDLTGLKAQVTVLQSQLDANNE